MIVTNDLKHNWNQCWHILHLEHFGFFDLTSFNISYRSAFPDFIREAFGITPLFIASFII